MSHLIMLCQFDVPFCGEASAPEHRGCCNLKEVHNSDSMPHPIDIMLTAKMLKIDPQVQPNLFIWGINLDPPGKTKYAVKSKC